MSPQKVCNLYVVIKNESVCKYTRDGDFFPKSYQLCSLVPGDFFFVPWGQSPKGKAKYHNNLKKGVKRLFHVEIKENGTVLTHNSYDNTEIVNPMALTPTTHVSLFEAEHKMAMKVMLYTG